MCKFGMASRIGGVGSDEGPVLNLTGFLTDSPHVACELIRRCPRTHAHVVGGRAAGAAIYPHRLCCAICKGIAADLRERRVGRTTTTPMTAKDLDVFGKRAAMLSLVCQDAGSVPITPGRVASISLLCQEASGGYPPEVVDNNGEFSMDGIQMEVDGEGDPTGKFRKVRPAGTTHPV